MITAISFPSLIFHLDSFPFPFSFFFPYPLSATPFPSLYVIPLPFPFSISSYHFSPFYGLPSLLNLFFPFFFLFPFFLFSFFFFLCPFPIFLLFIPLLFLCLWKASPLQKSWGRVIGDNIQSRKKIFKVLKFGRCQIS